ALSGGQRQRVAVGRATVRKPKAFLFDEPLSNLDAKMRVQMRAEISKLHQQLASTMIYVTHDQVEAMTMGDRIVVMKDGVIHQVAEPIDLYDHPQNMFVAGFIGSPSMNFFRGTLGQRSGGLGFTEQAPATGGAAGFDLPLPEAFAPKLASRAGQPVVFGVRPEDISLTGNGADAGPTVPAKVDVVEPMGAEIILYLTSASHTFIARVSPHAQVTVGQQVAVAFDLRKSHVFDQATEQALV
ncbi:TOBE domain-containing protein, partial [bacterium]|nr:TOBE domain-containing protein [bacterium]